MTGISVKVEFSDEAKKHMRIINRTKNKRILRKHLKLFCNLMGFDFSKYKAATY